MNIVWYVSDYHACGTVRADVPCRAINAKYGYRATLAPQQMISDLIGTDLIVIQRACTEHHKAIIDTAKSRGIKVIYDIDDQLLMVPEHVKDAWSYFGLQSTKDSIIRMLDSVDLITVSTRKLADELSKFTKNKIVIVPNCVDIGHADWSMSVQHKKDNALTIGWHGSSVHIGDVPVVAEALYAVLKDRPQVKLKLNGHFSAEHFGGKFTEFAGRVSYGGWIDPNSLYLHMRDLDIGLSPLNDYMFNLCKSNIKWLEYACAEVPCVASPREPYEDCKDGEDIVFAKNTGEWIDKLMQLVDNPDLRRRIGLAARLRAGREFDNKIIADKWISTFKSVLGWRS